MERKQLGKNVWSAAVGRGSGHTCSCVLLCPATTAKQPQGYEYVILNSALFGVIVQPCFVIMLKAAPQAETSSRGRFHNRNVT